MELSHPRLLPLLKQLAENTRRIHQELPGWYPKLLPALQGILETVTNPRSTRADLDLKTIELAKVLRGRPETEEIARVLEWPSAAADGMALPDRAELPEAIHLPGWLENEIEILTRKIIAELPRRTEPPAEPLSIPAPEPQ